MARLGQVEIPSTTRFLMQLLDDLRAGQLTGSTRFKLAAGLTEFPREIFDLAETLEVLDLSGNQLRSLPSDFGRLKQLKIAFFSNNLFETVPSVLADCPGLSMVGFKANRIATFPEHVLPEQLRWLILTDNCIETLPRSIGTLGRLQKLMLAGNRLRSLPPEMAACKNLELVRLSANQLETIPQWLLQLPRLAWLALGGNPALGTESESSRSLAQIDWTDLMLGETLGEGASGVISQAVLKQKGESKNVAVKLFKGAVTSDGFPADEMAACIAAGNHPNLVEVLGQLVNAPEQRSGLVLSLIPNDYSNLGNPPSLESCTRDTFPEGTTFSWPQVLRIAQGIASAAAHLHQRGIMHGDLYAHNILVNADGESLFGDFGAACRYGNCQGRDAGEGAIASALEKLEVRAFGCLLDDLLNHVAEASAPDAPLKQLRDDCLRENPSDRPSFQTLYELLRQQTELSH